MAECILFVDDEECARHAVERLFIDHPLPLLLARDGKEALEILRQREIAVIVSDHLMPGMTGVELLERVSAVSPDTVKMLVTAYADLSTALEAINRGEAFRFIVKPWNDNALLATVEQGVQRYRLIRAMKREDETIFRSLGQAIELKDPYTKGHCDRVAGYALTIAEALNFPAQLLKEVRFGSWLHDCGKIGVPEAILNFNGPVSRLDFDVIKKHPEWGAEVARKAHMSEAIINIILSHHERFDGRGYPAGLAGSDIPQEARIVAVADIFDALTSDRPYRKAYRWEKALCLLDDLKGSALDPELVEIFVENMFMKKGLNVL